MSDNIPIEIQMEIVKRVPVKSLFQFRSVSKSWKSLIDSSQFIADYNACKSRPQRLLIRYDDDPYRGYRFRFDTSYVCIVDDDNFPQHKFRTTIDLMDMPFEHLKELRLIGSSQGLLCFLGEYRHDYWCWDKAFIWNPAIRKSIAVDVDVFHEMYATNLGFGVCPKSKEPILVRIHHRDFPFQVDVFTLSSGVWRRLLSNLPHKSICFLWSHVAIDEFIYWQTTWRKLIVSFHMTSEEFVEINLPHSLAYPYKILSISKLRGSLAVLEHYMDVGKPVCGVWVMEHTVPKSFTKLFTVTTPNACLTKVLGFRKNGEVILEAKTDEDYEGCEPAVLEVYEPRSEHIKDLGIYGEHGSFFVSSYTETLLLLDQVKSSPEIQVSMH